MLAAVLALAVAACGRQEGEEAAGPTKATLILDFLPNPVHIAIYDALAQGYYEDHGVDLTIQTPTSTSDTLKLMAAGKADLGIVSLLDFLTSYQKGEPIKIVMALEQRPLGSLLTLESSGVTSPGQLEGKLVGVTGVPSDLAAVKSMVAYDGGDPAKVKTVTIGFNAVQNLLSGKVDAAVGFWNAEGVQLQEERPTRVFKLDDYGAPPYPELVVFARNETIGERPELVRGFVEATQEGYQDSMKDPKAGLDRLLDQTEGLSLKASEPQLDALTPVFQADAPVYGYVDLDVLAAYLAWAKEAGIMDLEAEPADFATSEFVSGG